MSESNIRVLSDDDAQALLPVLGRIGVIVDSSRSVIAQGSVRIHVGAIPTIGRREPARKTVIRHDRIWRY